MSIIYDALKKVETSQAADSKTKIDNGLKSKPKIYFVFALMVCLGLFVANIFYEWLIPKPLLDTTGIVTGGRPPIDKKQASAFVEAKMGTQKEIPLALTLNGVFFSGSEESYALINNRVVKKGDKIDGATVVQIFLDEVDLEFGGTIIKLSNSAR